MTDIVDSSKLTLSKKSRKSKTPTPIYRTSSSSGSSKEITSDQDNSTSPQPLNYPARMSPLNQTHKPEVSIALKPPDVLFNPAKSVGLGLSSINGPPAKSFGNFNSDQDNSPQTTTQIPSSHSRISPHAKPEVSIALKPPESLFNPAKSTGIGISNSNGAPIKSYSDFMRSLAAKYNNNDGLHADPLSSSPSAFKLSPNPLNPFLAGLPPAALQAFNLSNLAAATGQHAGFNATSSATPTKDSLLASAGASSPSALPFPSMMDHISTQALLSLAARSAVNTSLPVSASSTSKNSDPGSKSAAPKFSSLSSSRVESPLDLSGNPEVHGTVSNRKRKISENGSGVRDSQDDTKEIDVGQEDFASNAIKIAKWSTDEVVEFVESIDLCKEYSHKFREQNIDGSTLSLLTDDHLTKKFGMKLGPALKLRSSLLRRMGSGPPTSLSGTCSKCSHCHKRDQTIENGA